MFLILTGLILTFFILLFIITSIIHKKQFAYNTHQDYNYPSSPLPRMLPSRVAA